MFLKEIKSLQRLDAELRPATITRLELKVGMGKDMKDKNGSLHGKGL